MQSRRRRHAPANPSRIALGMVLIFAGLLRIWAALSSVGFDHPNEIYRVFELVAQWRGFSVQPPWEWTDGLLSSLPVAFHHGLLQAIAGLGVGDPLLQSMGLRCLYALASLLPVWVTWRWVERSGASKWMAVAAAAMMAFWPEWLYQSVRVMDYSLEVIGLALAAWLVFAWPNPKNKGLRHAAAGAILGALFFVRFQTGVHLVSFALAIALWGKKKLLRKPSLRAPLGFISAYVATVVVLGLIEAQGDLGRFLLPFRNYWQFNWVENGAVTHYGADVWHRYISETSKFYGHLVFLLLLGFCFRKSADRRILFLFVFPILVHSFVAHKEGRFVFGALWLLIPAAFSGAQWPKVPSVRGKSVVAATLVAFVVAYAVSAKRVSRRWKSHAGDVKAFNGARKWMHEADPGAKLPLVVETFPEFSPGGFFLQRKGPYCYRSERVEAQCRENFVSYFLLSQGEQPSVVEAGQGWSGRGWTVRRVGQQ